MSIKKWIMKQYWRVGTIRALSSLALGMFVLGRLYYIYIPGLQDMGLLGALILGTLLVVFFMGLGWLYDVRGKMWSPQQQASVERSPYYFIPDYRSLAIDYPVFYAVFQTMKGILDSASIETENYNEFLNYMQKFFDRSVVRKDLFTALPNSEKYMEDNPFLESKKHSPGKIGLGARAKLSFQIQTLRLTWIQSLTGLLQDVLIFGTFLITLIYLEGSEVVGSIIPLDILILGMFFISLPLFTLLLALGWLYDRKLRIWTPDLIVKVERNPFTFLAEPRIHIMDFPLFNTVLGTMKKIMSAAGADYSDIDRILQYLADYSNLDVSRDEDMVEARHLRNAFGVLFESQLRSD
ncbi:MAG: hypothetical protein ACFFAZ_05485 [Promethearchaeota archaeon]